MLYFFLCLLAATNIDAKVCEKGTKFQLAYEWYDLNYTWDTSRHYENAIRTQNFIPVNNALVGVKYYKETFYFAVEKDRPGVPVSMVSMPKSASPTNALLTPFPSWKLNDASKCTSLVNVESMEIDVNGVMWVIDGVRPINYTKCSPKIVLFDLNQGNQIVQLHEFPEQVSLTNGGFLNDIVVDGEFAYITENSVADPGLVVYCRTTNRSWKFRDPSMFAELNERTVVVKGVKYLSISPIDGIALSARFPNQTRYVYYSSLTGVNLWAISTDILQDEANCLEATWREHVVFIGKKPSVGGGMMFDNTGVLYYSLIPLYAVAAWNSQLSFSTATIIDHNNDLMVWVDGFTFDDYGYIYVLCHSAEMFNNPNFNLAAYPYPKFRLLKLKTCTRSYLY